MAMLLLGNTNYKNRELTWGHILHWYFLPVPPPPPELWEGPFVLPPCPLDNGCGTTNPAELGGEEDTEDPDVFDLGAP